MCIGQINKQQICFPHSETAEQKHKPLIQILSPQLFLAIQLDSWKYFDLYDSCGLDPRPIEAN